MINRFPIIFRCLLPIFIGLLPYTGWVEYDLFGNWSLHVWFGIMFYGMYQFSLLKKQCPSCRKWNAAVVLNKKDIGSDFSSSDYKKINIEGDKIYESNYSRDTTTHNEKHYVKCKKCDHKWDYRHSKTYYSTTRK